MLEKRWLYNQKMYAYSILILFLFLYGYRIYSGRMISDLYGQPLQASGLAYTYWLLLLVQIPQYIQQHYYIGIFIDVSILLIAIVLFFKCDNKYLAVLFLILLFIQNSTVEIYANMHNKMPIAIFIAFFPLCFNKKYFEITLEFSRYFLAFVLLSAAYHKFHNGAAYTFMHYYNVLINQHIDLSLGNPNHISYQISRFLLQSPYYTFIAFSLLIFAQGVFIIAFFTKKLDTILFVFFFLFVLLGYLIMRIWTIDLLILAPTLLYKYTQNKKSYSSE